MNGTVDLTALAALLATVTMIVVQLAKPLYEKIPHINEAANQPVHDNGLRLIQYGLNFGLLILAAHTVPSTFVGFQWYDLLAMAFGQAVISHVQYWAASSGSGS